MSGINILSGSVLNSILESFSCSRPVIVSNVRPLSDIVDNGIDGLVVEAKDENKWAEAMSFFILNPDDASRMGEEGKIN